MKEMMKSPTKLLDTLFEKSLSASRTFQGVVTNIATLATEVAKIAASVSIVAQLIHSQELAIQDLYSRLGVNIKPKQNDQGIDFSLPDINKEKTPKSN